MPNTIIIRKIKSELSKLELENFISRDFHPNIDGTFKNNFLTNKVDFTYASINSQEICIQMSIDNYNEILFNDYLLGYERIIKQIESLDKLLESPSSPVAWKIVTAYYASFFMAIELCKLLGIYLIYFDPYEVSKWTEASGESVNDFMGLLLAHRSIDDVSKDVTIKITKLGDSPHKKIWDQLLGRIRKEINKKNTSSSDHYDLELFKSLLTEQYRWKKPSSIRNLWNYNRADYYGETGEQCGATFLKIINDYKSSIAWAKSRSYTANIHNNTSSIAYIYHILKSATNEINKFINIE